MDEDSPHIPKVDNLLKDYLSDIPTDRPAGRNSQENATFAEFRSRFIGQSSQDPTFKVTNEETTQRHLLASVVIGKLVGMQERAESMIEQIRREGLNDLLSQAKAIRALMGVQELLADLERMFKLRRH
jgi:hypothetical protein